MFGLEGQKKQKKEKEFEFELEQELLDKKIHKDYRGRVEGQIQQIKNVLRDGKNKEDFDLYGTLLHGYTALLKVISRFAPR